MLAITYKLQHWMLRQTRHCSDGRVEPLDQIGEGSIQCCEMYVKASICNTSYNICQQLRTNCSIGCCCGPDTSVITEQNHIQQTNQERAASNAAIRQLGLTDLSMISSLRFNFDAASSILLLLLVVHWCGLVGNINFYVECCAVTAWAG